MRVLHARHDHGGGSALAPKSASERSRDPHGAIRQSLSMHGLCEDRRVRENGGGDAHMTASPITNVKRRGVPLIDGIEKVTGRALYTADLMHADALVGRIFRAPISHGEIVRLDVSKARAIEGGAANRTGADCPHSYGVLPVPMNEYTIGAEAGGHRGG